MKQAVTVGAAVLVFIISSAAAAAEDPKEKRAQRPQQAPVAPATTFGADEPTLEEMQRFHP